MAAIPPFIFLIWLLGLLSFAVIGAGIYLLREWYLRAWEYSPTLERAVFDPNFGWNGQTALLLGGLALIVWALAGGLILRLFAGLGSASRHDDPPRHTRGGTVHRLRRPDGSELQVESYGPADGTPVILTHGWGLNSTEWYYQWGERFRLIVWDLPGLGLSTRPQNNDYSLENLAQDLRAVLQLAEQRPAILLGHSIGGMITLTFARLFPELLGREVAGLALVHTTYTNPVRTVSLARLATALERPLIVPLLHLTIWLSPLVWLMNWSSYLNGTAHLITKRTGFAGSESWAQVDFATRFQLGASPAVLARGMFGMLAYDATGVLPAIPVPALVVPGDRDPVCRPEASAVMGREIPAAQLVALTPARHMGLIEHHERFGQIAGDFIAASAQAEPAANPVIQPQEQSSERSSI
jgi:pimeloyl-ACP methyl ester carboxylesterase